VNSQIPEGECSHDLFDVSSVLPPAHGAYSYEGLRFEINSRQMVEISATLVFC
jgi:hypothetical protein